MAATIKPEAIVDSSIQEVKLHDDLKTKINSAVRPDASSDGNIYARKNGVWVSIQDAINKALSALQSVPSTYRTATQQDAIDATKVPEAPNDGKQYARKNNAWAEVQSSSSGIPEAPTDGKKYTRQNAAWIEQDKGITDAPVDNKQYVRRNAAWSEITIPGGGVPEAPTDGKIYARQNGTWVEVSVDLSAILARLDALETAMSTITINV